MNPPYLHHFSRFVRPADTLHCLAPHSKSATASHIQAEEKELLREITNQPKANIEEIEQLSRLLLLTAAMTDGYKDAVKAAIDGAGRKQLILGGPEIVALATIGLVALHIVVTKGKSTEQEVMNVKEEDDKTVVSIKRKTTYGISDSLGKILKNYFPGTP